MTAKQTSELNWIANEISAAGGHPYLVGGAVRDIVLGQQPQDYDVEIYQMDADTLTAILSTFGTVDAVGKSFGVLKLHTANGEYDFSLPRRENRAGQGHKGFQVEVDPTMTPKDAASRRDFTMNAMLYNLVSDDLVDPFGGQDDLRKRLLRPTSEHFSEDPLRVLRGMQFAGRFELLATTDALKMSRALIGEYPTLAKERVWGEWYKWATKSVAPSFGLRFLLGSGWITLYPELNALIGLEQDRAWHPEGDAWIHSLMATDLAAETANFYELTGDDRAVLVFAALCHDLGKPGTTTHDSDGHIRARGHDEAGVEPTRRFLESIGAPKSIIERVIPLVREHMAHLNKPTPKSVRRLAARLQPASIRELLWVIECDHSARPPLHNGLPANAHDLRQVAAQLGTLDKAPAPILMGRHLIEMGFKPGPEFKPALDVAYQAQLDGHFATLDGAKSFAGDMRTLDSRFQALTFTWE